MLSIIIPTLNEERHIAKCLAALKKQLKPEDEVIVVDSYSKDKTVKIAKSYGATVILQPKKGIGLAKTEGARIAKNEILLFLDCDCVVASDFIQRIKGHFEDDKVIAVGGLGVYTSDSKSHKWTYDTYSKIIFYGAKIVHKISGKYWLASNNCAFRKKLFLSVGGYKSVICEDMELSVRLPKARSVVYDSKLQIELSDRRFKENGFLQTLGLWMWSDISILFGQGIGVENYRKD